MDTIPNTLSVLAADDFVEVLTANQSLLKERLDCSKEAYKKSADVHRQPGSDIKVGDVVVNTLFTSER